MGKSDNTDNRPFDNFPASVFIPKSRLVHGILSFSAPALDRHMINKNFSSPATVPMSTCNCSPIDNMFEDAYLAVLGNGMLNISKFIASID